MESERRWLGREEAQIMRDWSSLRVSVRWFMKESPKRR